MRIVKDYRLRAAMNATPLARLVQTPKQRKTWQVRAPEDDWYRVSALNASGPASSELIERHHFGHATHRVLHNDNPIGDSASISNRIVDRCCERKHND
jgi:hypothetical protein